MPSRFQEHLRNQRDLMEKTIRHYFPDIVADISDELIAEIKEGKSTISKKLHVRIITQTRKKRREIVTRCVDDVAPLFLACQRNLLKIAEFLITVCDADLEQRGLYEVSEDRSVHKVTPLWCAAVNDNMLMLKLLISHGADVNAVSDSGSTPVRSACFMSNIAIVKYLIENGADINRKNNNGGTCLTNAVQSVSLCQLLLDNGADINALDIQNKSALHHAIEEHRMETTILLVENGADIHAKANQVDDALQLACLRGAKKTMEYLLSRHEYPFEQVMNAHELLGATYVIDYDEINMALELWREAAAMRHLYGAKIKEPVLPTQAAFQHMREFQTVEELNEISMDLDAIKYQSLIVAERILGSTHKDFIFK